ncbi:unnamed protein product [Prunus armeniaca]|uniref:Ubiquitin-like domain-containing protein n=1 Tax=Prunus armeniaca TaxID=36596 RepID=A0A6J5WU03_PRUAR|nr:unnamed protein product [Prunus armeniaca]
MAGVQDQLEIKFRLTDGSDIGPKSFPAATSVVTLKESILAQWPKEKENGPRTVKDVKLISAGRILENNRTVGECRSPLCDVPGGVTTMHVVVQPPSVEKEKKLMSEPKQNKCELPELFGGWAPSSNRLLCSSAWVISKSLF